MFDYHTNQETSKIYLLSTTLGVQLMAQARWTLTKTNLCAAKSHMYLEAQELEIKCKLK